MLDELAGRARIAFIGEMDHFVAEKYEYRMMCVRYLAEMHNLVLTCRLADQVDAIVFVPEVHPIGRT